MTELIEQFDYARKKLKQKLADIEDLRVLEDLEKNIEWKV